jgi:serine/threonine protein kinase
MGGQPASANHVSPEPATARSGDPDPSEPAATIDFRAIDLATGLSAPAPSAATALEFAFLAPPREAGELGWLAGYRIRKLIGSGGMGLVFLADDTQLERPVALKVIRPELSASPDAAARFAREARAAASIKHDHVVTIYQVGQAQGVAYLAMEYLQGVSLQRWLERGRTPSVDLVLRIGREISLGLSAAHRLGLVHRDVKPGNIWLESPAGRVKILDFGQARAEHEDVQITQSGAIMGTPAFMSPEQAEGEPVGAASDLFSLGCVLYRICSGRLPFEGKTILSVLSALASQTPRPPLDLRSDLPAELSALIMRLLEKSPLLRPGSAQEVADALRAIERRLAADRQMAELGTVITGKSEARSVGQQGQQGLSADTMMATTPRPGDKPGPRRRRTAYAAGLVIALLATTFVIGSALRDPGAARLSIELPGKVATVDLLPPPSATKSTPTRPLTEIPTRAPELKAARIVPVEKPKPDPPVEVAISKPAPRVESPPRAPPLPPTPPPPLTPLQIWGTLIDPDGDCRVTFDEGRRIATFEVPGSPHVLAAEFRRMTAPRTLRSITGDFLAGVRVSGTEKVAGRSTLKEYAPYHGAGLLAWQDPGNYVRLEIASSILRGKPVHYANFEYRRDSRLEYSQGQTSVTGSASLRLERNGGEIIGSFSPDGVKWVSFPGLSVSLGTELKVGLVAINSATKSLLVQCEEFQVTPLAHTQVPGR